ncbi:MAG: hypothetical protein IPJ01_12225 [Micavibrio sp.]|nr:hypothetical protein [Micavibrio sp.]
MKTKITEHAFFHAKERMAWTRAETQLHADDAYNAPGLQTGGKAEFFPIMGRLLTRHKRAQTWATNAGAIFLFAGAVVVAIYRADEAAGQ